MKFNTKTTDTTRTVNLAGGEAYAESPKLLLVSMLLTSFLKDQYYRSSSESLEELITAIHQVPDKKFVAKAAVFARDSFGMRSVSHVVAGELATKVKGEQWTKNFFNKIVIRPDDMTEILAYYRKTTGTNSQSNAMKKGFAKAFTRFDEYQLAKYKGEGKSVSLLDVANVVHPHHTPAVEALIKGTLKPADTWETRLTQAGQKTKTDNEKDELKKDAWRVLLMENKLPYFALLRNLRNIIETEDPVLVEKAASLLINQRMIITSRVLPFRFLTAIEEMNKLNATGTRDILIALNKAIDIATQNAPKFEGSTLVALDESGSMGGQPQLIGSLFAAILVKSNGADLLKFDDDARYLTLNPIDSTLTLAQQIGKTYHGGGTNFNCIFEGANKKYDRIIILSDMQAWIGYDTPRKSFKAYKDRFNANPFIYSFDLAGYGTLQFPENNVFALAGFSEKVFELMKLMEQDRHALLNKIEEVELDG